MVNSKRRDTRLVHAGSHPEMHRGVMNPPVFRGSTVLFPTLDAMEKASAEPLEGVYYGRHGTPTSFALEEAVAELESADNAISVSSGLAAITASLDDHTFLVALFLKEKNSAIHCHGKAAHYRDFFVPYFKDGGGFLVGG